VQRRAVLPIPQSAPDPSLSHRDHCFSFPVVYTSCLWPRSTIRSSALRSRTWPARPRLHFSCRTAGSRLIVPEPGSGGRSSRAVVYRDDVAPCRKASTHLNDSRRSRSSEG
jgi:hypothetical protein